MKKINLKIKPKDLKTVVKIVFINKENKVLFLKRSEKIKKYPGEWDLPGGHLQVGEENNLIAALKREVKEETKITLNYVPKKLSSLENIHFYYQKQDLSKDNIKIDPAEHTDIKFFSEGELNPKEKFQKIALDALEKVK